MMKIELFDKKNPWPKFLTTLLSLKIIHYMMCRFFFQKNKWQTTSYSPSLTFLYIRFGSYFLNKLLKNINKLFYSLFQ